MSAGDLVPELLGARPLIRFAFDQLDLDFQADMVIVLVKREDFRDADVAELGGEDGAIDPLTRNDFLRFNEVPLFLSEGAEGACSLWIAGVKVIQKVGCGSPILALLD